MPNEMDEFMKRASCHEAGHIIVAFKLGIPVEAVRVENRLLLTDVWTDDLDSTARPAIDRYAFLAGGIAGEQFIFGDHDRVAMRDDQAKVTQRNGAAIDTYIPEARAILNANKSLFDRTTLDLTAQWIYARAEAQFSFDPDSYEILSRMEIDQMLQRC